VAQGLSSDAGRGVRATEALATGMAFAALLCWVTTALVGTFRPQGLPAPYWQALPWLRTDSLGFVAFIAAAASLPVSEYLRLRRRRTAAIAQSSSGRQRAGAPLSGPGALVVLAAAETIAVLATGLVGYLSLNAITHPQTLLLHVTHLLPWPSEGTLRVAGLLLCFGSVTAVRYLRAASDRPDES
jgi:hypothetical protein